MTVTSGRRVGDLQRQIMDLIVPELENDDPHLNLDATFTDLGLDSTGVVAVAAGLSTTLGTEVPVEVFFDHPSIRRLAEHLASGSGTTDDG